MKFEKHLKVWFLNRVGKTIFTVLTSGCYPVVIKSKKHAEALFNYHRDYRLNYSEIEIKKDEAATKV